MRTYGQYCSVAKALDVIGDRWTLLIIRELLLRGACRYTDLKNGLPGIATNLLADRIRDLEAAGLVRREEAPPPVATTLVHLTQAGAELEPVLRALGWWGIRFMRQPADADEFRSQWLAYPVEFFLRDHAPDDPPAAIELRTASDPAVIEIGGGRVGIRLGQHAAPDLVLEGGHQLMLGLLTGQLTVGEVTERGLRVSGDTRLLDRVLTAGG
ncbi:MAG TPA: helix-turn-helix domain-containing protein [Trebonia sp.]|nr:helix-turn-helix domain-containing protein [Trebonia sp.]